MGSSVRLREALSAGGPGGTSKDKATADGVLTRTNESSEGRAISPIDAAAAAAGVGGASDDNEAGKKERDACRPLPAAREGMPRVLCHPGARPLCLLQAAV